MTGFEPRTFGIGSDRSTNWATTTSQLFPWFALVWAQIVSIAIQQIMHVASLLQVPRRQSHLFDLFSKVLLSPISWNFESSSEDAIFQTKLAIKRDISKPTFYSV